MMIIAFFLLLTVGADSFAIMEQHQKQCSVMGHHQRNRKGATLLHSTTPSAPASAAPPLVVVKAPGKKSMLHATTFSDGIVTRGGATIVTSSQTSPTTTTQKPLASLKTFAASLLELWFQHVPQPLRFFLSGRCGDVCFFFCERYASHVLSLLLAVLPSNAVTEFAMVSQDTTSFLIGYFLHIVPQHWIHAALVYGLETIDTRPKYWATLKGMYSALLTAAVGSTALNTLLLNTLPLSKTAAFVLTLWIFSVINYFWIGWVVKRSSKKAEEEEATKGVTATTTHEDSPLVVRPGNLTVAV